jgi:3-dehydroquinate synthase
MEKFSIRPAQAPPLSEFYLGRHLLEGDLLKDLCHPLRMVIIADHAMKALGEKLARTVGADLFTIPSGEKSKTRKAKEDLENELLKAKCGRDTMLIALGGGVTTDLVGFVASTYLRGVPLILIPTTVLAMVDASIGGKTGVDTSFGKNLVGSFYPPKAIIADLETLKTLPQKEEENGLSEILKMGLIADASIWENPDCSEESIRRAIKGKIAIIETDPHDQGLRRILNFGHTIGHALERISNYDISHGEAVAIGCLAEAHLSLSLGYLSPKEFERVLQWKASVHLPKTYQRKDVWNRMAVDKKKAGELIRFVLIDRIGHAMPFDGEYCRPVNEQELAPTLDWMEDSYG